MGRGRPANRSLNGKKKARATKASDKTRNIGVVLPTIIRTDGPQATHEPTTEPCHASDDEFGGRDNFIPDHSSSKLS